MSTTISNSGPDDPDSERVRWRSSTQLEYAIGHVFLPAQRGYTIPADPVENNDSFARAVCATAHAYSDVIDDTLKPQWCRITKMLDFLQAFLQPGRLANDQVISQLRGMQTGDILVLLNRVQDAAIIFTRQDRCVLFEVFRTSDALFKGLYRECAMEIPDEAFHDQVFQSELADFLLRLNGLPGHGFFSEHVATRPIGLLTSILRGVCRSTEAPIITRAGSHYKLQFWRRSLLWLLIKLSIQMSLSGDLGSICYKVFLLHFMCNLANDAMNADLSSHLLHAISVKILRRLRKLGSSAPNWLHGIVITTNAFLRDTLEGRWKEIEVAQRPSILWEPSQLDLDGDTQLSVVRNREYIRNALTDLPPKPLGSPFCPKHLPRGTLNDFLSSNGSFFRKAYLVEPYVALYDVEQAVEHELDDWIASVRDVGQACLRVAALMDTYLSSARCKYWNPEHKSIMHLTVIELWVALDKLVVGVFPMLADYFLRVPIETPHSSHFREAMNLHRLCRAYQYLSARGSSARHSQSNSGLSVLQEFTTNIFPGRHSASIQYKSSPEDFRRYLMDRFGMPLHVAVWWSCTNLPSLQDSISDVDLTYRLQSSHGLDKYLKATSHASNGVLAAQTQCPDHLSLNEFVAFGHLRSGGSLQWANILRELRSRTLNFRRHDVHLLLAQAASQVGPLDLNTAEWIWHQELQESSFCGALLDELESLLVDVAVHSLDGVMMGTITFFLTRLLGSNPSEDVEERAIELLQHIRRKTFHWVQELSRNLITAPTNSERSNLLRDLAITCRSTFHVAPNTVHKVLRSAEDVDALLFCAILLRVNIPIDPQSISEYSRLLLERNCRLSLVLESVLTDVILADGSNRGIDLAVRRVWFSYHPSPREWQALPHPNSHWLTCETATRNNRLSQTVHLNLLNGTLLVDGKPIVGLPREIREQPTYQQIFGDQFFLVIASDLPGMDFCSLTMISEHRVHFGLQSSNLVIRAQHKDAIDILEVVPHGTLETDLPATLVDGYVHWLNLSTSTIEIRPLDKIWEQSSDNWRIDCVSGKYRMYKGCERLVDIRSRTYEMVSSRLWCLDVPENLIITTSPIGTPQSSPTQRLSVVLPRYGLSFFVNEEGELESRDFRNMVYDRNQCIGALFGLENRLVLRQTVQAGEELVSRCVIIPEGRFSRKQHNHHVHVGIAFDGPPTQPITYHMYHVDTDLGCLTGYASWRSKLYLACLHAETSVDWMPDPLTGRTGIEEALCLLRSAGCRSIMELDICHEKAKLPFSVDQELYSQIKFAMQEIEYLIKRARFLRSLESASPSRPDLDVIGALRTAYLFPSEVVTSKPAPINVDPPKFESSAPEDLAHTISLAVYHWLVETEIRVESGDRFTDTSLTVPRWANSGQTPPSISEVETFLQEATRARQHFRLLFLLPTLVYCQADSQPHLLAILVALAKRFPLESPPRYAQCQPLYGYRLSKDALQEYFVDVPVDQKDRAVETLLEAWPCKTAPVISLGMKADVRTIEELDTRLQTLISNCHRNLELKEDLTRRLTKLETTSHVLQNEPQSSSALVPHQALDLPLKPLPHMPWRVEFHQLLSDRSAPNVSPPILLRRCGLEGNRVTSKPDDAHALNQLFDSLQISKTEPSFQQQYIARLHASAQHVREVPGIACGVTGRPSIEALRKHYVQSRVNYRDNLIKLKEELGPMDDPLEQVLHRSCQWPQITPEALFRCLASTSPIKLPHDWKRCLVSLALLLLELQRSRRLLRLALDDLEEEFLRELENDGCDGWRAEDYPDWLLIQIQGNFLIRGIQADVATKTISPQYGENSAVQVNMGEGKSSVILPISAVALANGNQLVRVIVPKALTVQMFRLLVDRLGGLVDRPVHHLPFSRPLTGRYDYRQFRILHEFLSECMSTRGVLVVQPEHILSLKLTTVEEQLHEHSSGALLDLQRWIDSHVRDILDESDEVFHPRFQLMYTIGQQRDMEGYPDRWTITQQVLRLAKNRVTSLLRTLPDAIEYEHSPSGSFPRIRILRTSDTCEHLISLIADDVMNGHLPGFTLRDIDRDQQLRNAVRAFISSKEVFKQTASVVEKYTRQTGLWDGILLLRGLLACGILWFALAERRWRVDYGLSPDRTMLAVPYRAKDVPAPGAEFGHPDVTIILTCLSYYYGGLAEEQLRASFKLLQEQDDPFKEYSNWLRDHDLRLVPKSIQDLRNVNIKSSEQWEKYLFPLFARNQAAVDFYLSRVVFPKEAKEFPWKLAATSWDLAEMREHPITGFSGTNDNQYLLPTSIAQRDPDHQLGTNARVLSHLLQSNNNFYMLISDPNGERRTTLELLRLVVDQQPKIRVFLDLGAQILDLSNYQVVKAWLDLSADSDGAIYFNDVDELVVLTKDGTKRHLASSPLAQQLERCVIYLDDAHTRGTDLKLPSGSRAAVTLGPKVTKDRLVQGCMRMRKLGHGHSVVFFAPPEVDRSIRATKAREDQNNPVTITDILRWAIHETWTDIQQRAPYWAQQGINHNSRYNAWSHFYAAPDANPVGGKKRTRKNLADAWLQPELKSLADLYMTFQPENTSILDGHSDIQQRCIELGAANPSEAQMDEEQEREVNREIEREREPELRLFDAKPAEHSLHPGVVALVKTGIILPWYTFTTFHPVFTTLKESSATKTHIWCPFVLATSDFCKTIERDSHQGKIDPYLRPVQWVLSGKMHRNRVLVLLSPFEADCLMPDIRASKHVHLHVYTPRTSESMRPADDLKFYSIPPLPDDWTPPWDLIDQLNLFSGQLYLRDYDSYLRLCHLLGIQNADLTKNVGRKARHKPTTAGVFLEELRNTFTNSPLPSVMKLLVIRRRGLPFAESHMGRIIQGQRLTEKDFGSVAWATSSRDSSTRDAQMLQNVVSVTTVQDSSASSTFSRSSQRELETS